MERIETIIKAFGLPFLILMVGSMSKFLLWNSREKTWRDFLVFVIFGWFLMMMVTFTMDAIQATTGLSETARANTLPLLYAFSALGSKETLEILIKRLPDELVKKILGNIN